MRFQLYNFYSMLYGPDFFESGQVSNQNMVAGKTNERVFAS